MYLVIPFSCCVPERYPPLLTGPEWSITRSRVPHQVGTSHRLYRQTGSTYTQLHIIGGGFLHTLHWVVSLCNHGNHVLHEAQNPLLGVVCVCGGEGHSSFWKPWSDLTQVVLWELHSSSLEPLLDSCVNSNPTSSSLWFQERCPILMSSAWHCDVAWAVAKKLKPLSAPPLLS